VGRAGLNGRWFTITEDQRSWADPLQGLDNVSRTGQPTREDAAARVEEIMRPRLEDEARGLAGLGGLAGLAGLADLDAAAERRLLGYS